jgi:P4 family phage/plasmid primase-like protien
MTAYSSGVPAGKPPGGDDVVIISRFRHKRDTAPRPEQRAWSDLAGLLSRHAVRGAKDGPLWAPVRFRAGTDRAAANVEAVTGLVYDVDHTRPDWRLLEGVAFVAYTTFSHTAADPHWRLVLHLARPVPAAQWARVWRRGRARYAPMADPACSDPCRMYYLPTHPPGRSGSIQIGEGAPVDVGRLPETPEEVQERELAVAAAPERPPGPMGIRGERPGDRFAREASWTEILAPHGWRPGGERWGQEVWRRPGRADDQAARSANTTRDGNLWVWTSNAPPFESQHSYTKLHAHVLLEHGGDWTAAIKALAARDRGQRRGSAAVVGSPSGPRSAPPAQPVSGSSTNGYHAVRETPPGPPGAPPDAPGPAPALTRPEPDGHPLTDVGNAERLLERYGEHLRYAPLWHRWLVYDGIRWVPDADECRVRACAKETVRQMARDALGLLDGDPTGAKALFGHAARCEAAGRLAAMVTVAQSFAQVWVTPDELDADPWLLNCRNGTVDLRTGARRPHRPADLLTKLAPVDYDPAAACPRWERFIAEVTCDDRELAEYIRRAIGHSLTGDVSEQAVYFPYGKGSNGKSTLLNTVKAAAGEYAMQAKDDLLLVKRGESHPTELADLYRRRLVVSTEVEDGRRLAEALVKQLTGGERIRARRMREDFWEFDPTHKVWVAANHKPEIRGTDFAIWRRIRLIPFDATFYDRPEDVPAGQPPRLKDATLADTLRTELPGVLAWAIRGCVAWRQDGITVPGRVHQATAQYREEMDVLAAFLEDRCEGLPQASAPASALYQAYDAWCGTNGEKAESQRKFGDRLSERGYGKSRDPSTGRIVRLGVRLRADDSSVGCAP